MGPGIDGTGILEPCFTTTKYSPFLSIIIQLSSKIAKICVKKFAKNEIRRAFLRDLLVRDRPGNFVREWTVREVRDSRTVPYRTGNFPYYGNTNLNRNLRSSKFELSRHNVVFQDKITEKF